jgi:hypothetical protein
MSPSKQTQVDACLAKSRKERCVNDINRWLINNKLKLNEDKTELLLISSKFQSRPVINSIQVGEEAIQHQSSVRNLGAIFDQDMSFNEHISKICKSSQHHLRNIREIRKFLDERSCETLFNSCFCN